MNPYPYIDPGQTGQGSWSAAQAWGPNPEQGGVGDLRPEDAYGLPAFVYSQLPLPGNELAAALPGYISPEEMTRFRNYAGDPQRYFPQTSAERNRPMPTLDQENLRPYEQLGPVADAAMLAMPVARGAFKMGEAAVDVPVQAYRRAALGNKYPELGQAFSELGNPVTNTWRAIVGSPKTASQSAFAPMAAETSMAQEAAPSLLDRVQRGVDRWAGSWNVDVPYITDGKYPQVLITKDASNEILPRLGAAISGRDVPKTANGWNTVLRDDTGGYLADIIAARQQALPTGTLTHETGHLAKRRILGYGEMKNQPAAYVNEARAATAEPLAYHDYLDAVTSTNPRYDRLFRKPGSSYENLSPVGMGDELWTRYNAGQLGELQKRIPFNDPEPLLGGRVSDLVDSLIHPTMR